MLRLQPSARPQKGGYHSKLRKHHRDESINGTLDDMDIPAECPGHLLAGIDTTSDTLMFLVFSLPRTEGRVFQKILIDEVQITLKESPTSDGTPTVEANDQLDYPSAVIKETLRLFAHTSNNNYNRWLYHSS
jgi:cytochrome P450